MLVVLLFASSAAASPIWADELAVEGQADVEGTDAFLATAGSAQDALAPVHLAVTAARAEIHVAGERGAFVPAGDVSPAVATQSFIHEPLVIHNVTFSLEDQRPDRKVLILGVKDVSGKATQVVARSYDSVVANAGEPFEARPAESSSRPQYYFSQEIMGGGVVVTSGGTLDLTMQGSMILEFYEMDLAYASADSSGIVESGFRDDGTEYEDTFVRVFLEDAIIHYAAAASYQWVGSSAVSASMAGGDLVIVKQLHDGQQAEELMPAPDSFTLEPRYNKIGIHVSEPAPSTAVALPAAWQAPLLSAGLAFTLLGVAVFLALRLGRDPKRVMEKALEAGDHTKAAAEAARILANDPSNEGARIGRAVALTRAGRWGDVVDELEQHRRMYTATDGVLDYLLGVAYLETGARDKAREAMERAVAATPALAHDAIARMPNLAPRLEGAYA